MLKQGKQDLFKELMSNYPTGVTVVTTTNQLGEPVGLTVNSFASVSLDPMLILWSIDHKVSSLEAFMKAGKFAVHILALDQEELCKTFASKNTDRFSKCNWSISKHQLPIIKETLGVLQCETFKLVEAGDHTILIGRVIDIDIKEQEPLVFHRRGFGKVSMEGHTIN